MTMRVGFNNPTVLALLSRGIPSSQTMELHYGGETLASLKQSSDLRLAELGLTTEQVAAVRSGNRPAVPKENVLQIIWANRFTCCVCREGGKTVVIHHIDPWAESHSHAVNNLAVLCLEHHAHAHRKETLEQNLSPDMLRQLKLKWEALVRTRDASAIMEVGRNPAFHWWWFNHVRIIEMARAAGIDVSRSAYFLATREHAQLEKDGSLGTATFSRHYLYQGGNGILL